MVKLSQIPHPYHHSADKNLIQRLIDWALPVGLFILYFTLYNFGKFTPPEMIKTTGLMAIALLSITLVIGPLSRFVPSINVFKAHRKFWGISSFVFLVIHACLVVIIYFELNIFGIFNTASPKFIGLFAGFISLLVLLLVTVTSNHRLIKHLNPEMWKKIQTTSYIALTLAVIHFYLMELKDGVLVINRSLGQITFWFATIVVLFRLIVFFLPKKDESQN